MKTVYTIILFLLPIISANAQIESSEKTIQKLGFNIIKSPYLFIYPSEISNEKYREFVHWTNLHLGHKAASLMHPDTLVWRSSLGFNEPYVRHYYKHPAYNDYPVVGISHSQAVAYCNWLAERIMETAEFKNSQIAKIRVRLPSETEWMMAARGGLPSNAIYPWEGNTIRIENGKKKDFGKARLNVRISDGWYVPGDDAGFITTPVESYWPNGFGLYNMSGNVSEWVEAPNKAKGGDWNQMPYNARIDIPPMVLDDSVSSSYVGFRPLLEIVELKDPLKTKNTSIDAKYLDKLMAGVTDSLYAAKTETTNALYNQFLKETKNEINNIDNSGWMQYTRYDYYKQYGSHSLFANYPVVNISYEAANNFCRWLTEKYNNTPGRSFKKVVFRLPEFKEWEQAARAGHTHLNYPWSGPFTRNSRGLYLANFNPLEEQYLYKEPDNGYSFRYPEKDSTISRSADGVYFTCAVNSYFPNALGLYQCAGNVAEMTATKGISKGGSWTSISYYLQIDSYETYTGSNANLGFRFFMEVLEK